MRLVVTLVAVLMLVPGSVAQAQQGGALGGVLDALGSILGGGTQKLQGTVVVARDTTLVLRTPDRRTYRIDMAAVDPQTRQGLAAGDTVTVTARGGQGNVLTATQIERDAAGASKPAEPFRRVSGTIEESTASEVVFKTRDGLVLPVDTTQIRGLPFFAANQPATLIYEQGPRREIVGVWIEPGDAQPAASPTTGTRRVQGTVDSIGRSSLSLHTNVGDTLTVDTTKVDRGVLDSIRPGDVVTVTAGGSDSGDRLVAQSIETGARAGR